MSRWGTVAKRGVEGGGGVEVGAVGLAGVRWYCLLAVASHVIVLSASPRVAIPVTIPLSFTPLAYIPTNNGHMY